MYIICFNIRADFIFLIHLLADPNLSELNCLVFLFPKIFPNFSISFNLHKGFVKYYYDNNFPVYLQDAIGAVAKTSKSSSSVVEIEIAHYKKHGY
jgi:hypothetical protein